MDKVLRKHGAAALVVTHEADNILERATQQTFGVGCKLSRF